VFKYQSDISWIVFRYQLDSVQISVANVRVLGLTVCLNLRFVSPALICVSSSEEKRVFSVEINDGF
jgi:hypothetical protein